MRCMSTNGQKYIFLHRFTANSLAAFWQRLVLGLDQRLLLALVSLGGLLAWFAPWPCLFLFFSLALLSANSAYKFLPGGRPLLKACVFFALFWVLSFFLLQLWEQWGRDGAVQSALAGAIILGGRLLAVLGMTFLLPLCLSPVSMGRALTWYLERPALLLRGGLRDKALQAAWKSGLALAVMAAFLPRTWRILRGLSQTMRLRAPQLKTHRRFWLLGLAALRVLGAQTWDMSVSITARGLYRPEPWSWREPVKKNAG